MDNEKKIGIQRARSCSGCSGCPTEVFERIGCRYLAAGKPAEQPVVSAIVLPSPTQQDQDVVFEG